MRYLYSGEVEPLNALMMVKASEHFGVQARGVRFLEARHFYETTLPCVAHVTTTRGRFPRPLPPDGPPLEGKFVVIEGVGERLSIIDPLEGGRQSVAIPTFMESASGVAIVFDDVDG